MILRFDLFYLAPKLSKYGKDGDSPLDNHLHKNFWLVEIGKLGLKGPKEKKDEEGRKPS